MAEVSDLLLARLAWGRIGGALMQTMPDDFRETIGRHAIEGASYVSQLETINASRHARGVKPLTMTLFAAGVGDDE
jgi:hypothetical protein